MPGDSGIEYSPDAFCRPEPIGKQAVMIAQQPIAVLPVPEACVGPAKQHGAKGRTELAEIVQSDKKRCCLIALVGPGQRPSSSQSGRHRSDV